MSGWRWPRRARRCAKKTGFRRAGKESQLWRFGRTIVFTHGFDLHQTALRIGYVQCESFAFADRSHDSRNLNQAPVRQWHRIAAHSAHHPRLLELGFLPLENVRVLQRSWFKTGALVVQVGDAVFGLRPDEAMPDRSASARTKPGRSRSGMSTATVDISGMAQRRLALLGNPNCGKTALFNRLTGSKQKVANYAGVTVELKRGLMKTAAGRSVTVIDLPGTYSLNPSSQDEAVACDMVLGQSLREKAPDLTAVVLDATRLRRGLRLVAALKRLGVPMVVVLNMMDRVRAQGRELDVARLQAALGVPVVEATGISVQGTDALRRIAGPTPTFGPSRGPKHQVVQPVPTWSAPTMRRPRPGCRPRGWTSRCRPTNGRAASMPCCCSRSAACWCCWCCCS